MFISANAFFKDGTANNTRVLIRAETALPDEFRKAYLRNVRKQGRTPMKTGALRRSIITQATAGQAQISWRMPYAKAQNDGGARGRVYRNYTTPGTGKGFAQAAYKATVAELPAMARQLGLTK